MNKLDYETDRLVENLKRLNETLKAINDELRKEKNNATNQKER